MFSDNRGETHFEDVDVPLKDLGRSSELSEVFETTGMVFRHTKPDYDLDFHNAPRRQFIVNLTGGVEIEVSDGEVRRFKAGEIILAEDTTGKGHKSRALDGQERFSLFVHVP
jgi:quercetin dioxygenase-like cupin family protein